MTVSPTARHYWAALAAEPLVQTTALLQRCVAAPHSPPAGASGRPRSSFGHSNTARARAVPCSLHRSPRVPRVQIRLGSVSEM